MRRTIEVIFFLVLSAIAPAFAQESAVRNDSSSTTVITSNLGRGPIGVDSKGRVAFFTNAITVAHATYAFGSITGSYTTALTNSASLRYCRFYNSTDAGVIISVDASTDFLDIAAGATVEQDWGANGRHVASNISVKRLAGAPTSGNLYVDCYS